VPVVGTRGPLRSLGSVVVLIVVTAACTTDSTAPPMSPSPSALPTTSASASPSQSGESPIAVTGGALTLSPPDDGSFLLHGTYPKVASPCKHATRATLTARYPGSISIRRGDDGTLTLTLTLPFERYLEGIAEVPPSWPPAALDAQVIAARSYALASTGWSGPQGETLDTPICATTSCQVYRGIPVPPEPSIGRWYAAVRRTTGLVLVSGDRPAETVYFSTSNGQTYGNEQVFGSAALPYLRPVAERDDSASPESHWRVSLPFRDLARFLRAAGEWPDGVPISDVGRSGSTMTVAGGGTSRSLDESSFRSAVNTWAPCLEPGRYPGRSWKGDALPTTIPSGWFGVTVAPGAANLSGRGWGHGVGMVQWGAYGKARRGLSANQILSFYYGGLRPRPFAEPGLIHVQVATGVTSVRIAASGRGATIEGRALDGPVLVTGGDRITVAAVSPSGR
jgi:stage II sporulation protein D (peptidoglycan lytic transglycosylase)